VNSQVVCVTSIVGKLNLALASRLPIAVMDNIGEMHGLTPPSLSDSARLKLMRSSYSVSPPKLVEIKTPSDSKVSLKA